MTTTLKSIPKTIKPKQKVVLRAKTKRDGTRHSARALASECGAEAVELYGEVYVFLDVVKYGVEDESGKVRWQELAYGWCGNELLKGCSVGARRQRSRSESVAAG